MQIDLTKQCKEGSMNISNSREVSQMILQFSCSNHKSIKEKVTFSAIASSDNTFEETLKKYQKNLKKI